MLSFNHFYYKYKQMKINVFTWEITTDSRRDSATSSTNVCVTYISITQTRFSVGQVIVS